MDIILDAIKMFCENSTIWISVIVIFSLIKLYKQKEEEQEENLILKMIGYYLLGCFTFSINGMAIIPIAIPVGFITYYTSMMDKEKRNKKLKHKCAVLGLVIIILGFINGITYQALEYRDYRIKEYTGKLRDLDDAWLSIEDKLKLEGDSYLMDFSMNYDTDKNINDLSIRFTNPNHPNKLFTALCNFEGKLTVDADKFEVDEFSLSMNPDYYYGANVEDVIKLVANLEFAKSPLENGKIISSYNISYDAYYSGTSSTNIDSDGTNYIIDSFDEGFKNIEYREAKLRELPLEGTIIRYSPMEKVSESEDQVMSAGTNTDSYVLYANINENLIKDNTEKLVIENIKDNKTITLSDFDYAIDEIVNSLEFYSWEEIDLKSIDSSPYLKFKDSFDSVITIYENNYALYKGHDETIVYKLPINIIENVTEQINLINE